MKILTTLILVMLTSHSYAASGGLFVEPYATYESGTAEMNLGTDGDPDGDLEGWGAGLRLGLHAGDIFFVGLDGMYSEPDFKDDSGDSFDFDTKSWLLGPVVGLQTPFAGLRIWGAYMLAGEIELDKTDDAFNIAYKDPKIFKLGAGLRIGVVSLNLECLSGTYEKVEVKNAGPFSGTYDSELDRDSYILSLSFPFSL
ncbi:MAG: hypothetical protein KDD37_11605 [Bdellovibrionales bacterium]|nr:hypothetical protein [Bdellovibrionales bacterium]